MPVSPRPRPAVSSAPMVALTLAVGALLLGLLAGPAAAAPAGTVRDGASSARTGFTPPKKCLKLHGKARARCVRKARQQWVARNKRRCTARGGHWLDRRCWSNPARTTGITAHEGGGGMTAGLTVSAYQRAMATGVSSVHLPIRFDQDDRAVVSATDTPGKRCRDGAPAHAGDPEHPYAGRRIATLDAEQLSHLECGSWTPGVTKAPGSRLLDLATALTVVRHQGAAGRIGLELQLPRATDDQIAALLAQVAGFRVQVSSADWALLARVAAAPGGDAVTTVGIDAGRSGDPVAQARAAGLDGWSPVSLWRGTPYLTKARTRAAHAAGLRVTTRPLTQPRRITRAVLAGADEILSPRPDQVRRIMTQLREARPAPLATPAVPHRILDVAHAHNDYVHARPLLDALDAGFTSVEADVFWRGGELRVAHEESTAKPGVTLEKLYLEPLARLVDEGRPLTHGRPFRLLVDIKDDGLATYRAIESALQATLAEHPGLFRQYVGPDSGRPAPVEVVVSGARPLAHMQSQTERWIGYDGRPADLDTIPPLGAALMPLVSQSWLESGQWAGTRPMTDAEHDRLASLLTRSQQQGATFRFWLTYDWVEEARTRIWTALYDMGFGAINADDLTGFADFVENRDPWFLGT